jgi:hypothetical protein
MDTDEKYDFDYNILLLPTHFERFQTTPRCCYKCIAARGYTCIISAAKNVFKVVEKKKKKKARLLKKYYY